MLSLLLRIRSQWFGRLLAVGRSISTLFNEFVTSSKGERPAAMWRAGRAADQDFQPEHDLYYRLKPHWVQGAEVCVPQHNPPFDLPAFSVNWSKYSRPEWVLIPPADKPDVAYKGFSVAAIKVGHLPAVGDFSLRAEHRPEEDNYSHSEVTCFDSDAEVRKPPRSDRMKLRDSLARKARVLPS